MEKYYQTQINSPLGEVKIACTDEGLTCVALPNQRFECLENATPNHPILEQTKRWLEEYFAGKQPTTKIPLAFKGTDFQKEVWQILLHIPYGKTLSYGAIAKRIADKKNLKKMSAQAVGGAVGKNPIAIIIPCHRVVGTKTVWWAMREV